ncbi:MAG: START domain-containing protein [Marinobacter sp.]|uniref:START domain-containing protein n=1 Tax=Marinobacter sp. TaxID=50741 RepID=UPI00299D850D|nr:START domain-containing protein [Marinobacter sp.]MDX1633518.1 START domain-containing protein [Marinobacter sp.]
MPSRLVHAVAGSLLLIAGWCQAEVLPAENADWQLQKEVDDIRIYTIDQDDSPFRAFKAEALLDVPLSNVMAVMLDPTSCLEWVHGCSESRAFGAGDFADRYAYSVNDMPWPVSDRDYVIRIRTQGNEANGEVVMNLNAVPARQPEQDGLVRVDRSDTLYRFEPVGDKTRMIWLQHTDPNGALPGWLVNSLLVDIPLKSMQQLERVAASPRYDHHELVYDEQGNLVDVRQIPQTGDDENNGKR